VDVRGLYSRVGIGTGGGGGGGGGGERREKRGGETVNGNGVYGLGGDVSPGGMHPGEISCAGLIAGVFTLLGGKGQRSGWKSEEEGKIGKR